jgi:PRTRC genetic system protein A
MDKRDAALAKSFPVVTVPKYGDFEPMAHNGQRLLIAGNGFFLEVRRDWIHAIQRCAITLGAVRYPFGDMLPFSHIAFGHQIPQLMAAFLSIAQRHFPDEVGGVLLYNRTSQCYTLKECASIAASSASLKYSPPSLSETESIAVDIHSHGRYEARFSSTDDADDIDGVKIAMVVGLVDTPTPTLCMRLCLSGLLLDMRWSETAFVPLNHTVAMAI